MDIYIAWASGFLVLIATVALFFSGCNTDDEDDGYEEVTFVATPGWPPLWEMM